MTAYILLLEKEKMVSLDISEPHSVLVCVETISPFIEKIQEQQLEDPQLSGSGHCSSGKPRTVTEI